MFGALAFGILRWGGVSRFVMYLSAGFPSGGKVISFVLLCGYPPFAGKGRESELGRSMYLF